MDDINVGLTVMLAIWVVNICLSFLLAVLGKDEDGYLTVCYCGGVSLFPFLNIIILVGLIFEIMNPTTRIDRGD